MPTAPQTNGRARSSPHSAAEEKSSVGVPEKYTYALASFSTERRPDGWYIARSKPSFVNERMTWSGPFETIETACLSIARHLAVELADRHTRIIERHKLKPGDPLYGLKTTTRLRTGANGSVA